MPDGGGVFLGVVVCCVGPIKSVNREPTNYMCSELAICEEKLFQDMIFLSCLSTSGEQNLWIWLTNALIQEIFRCHGTELSKLVY